MNTLAERIISKQKDTLRKVNNARFEHEGWEYRINYDGGIAEFISIYGRKKGGSNYKYIDGFVGYKFFDKEQVIAYAKNLIYQKV